MLFQLIQDFYSDLDYLYDLIELIFVFNQINNKLQMYYIYYSSPIKFSLATSSEKLM